jgi:hypothetical protein
MFGLFLVCFALLRPGRPLPLSPLPLPTRLLLALLAGLMLLSAPERKSRLLGLDFLLVPSKYVQIFPYAAR